jgi:hypothetical protein
LVIAAATLYRVSARHSLTMRIPGFSTSHAAKRSCGCAVQPLVLEGSLPLVISEGLAGFSAFAPPGVLTRPEWPQRAFDRLAEPNLADLVAGAIKTFVADRAERTLRLVSGLARNA